MPFYDTPIPDLKIFEPRVWEDERGYFFESFNERTFQEAGIDTRFVQDNQALSQFGVLRGLHYQIPPYAQAKLVRVLEGEVLDIAVDIRPGSPTYGRSFGVILSAENKKQLFVPRGFAHGYAVLSSRALFFYKCDNYYSKEHEGGIRFDDPALEIDWELSAGQIVLSDKDRQQPAFGQHRPFLPDSAEQ
jgi:dTDP-4-dehydrorhamnose 3,5-epimerase